MRKRIDEKAHVIPPKKRKLDETPQLGGETSDIASAFHLQQLLKFQQDSTSQLLAGIKSFKRFLESIAIGEDKLKTLKQQTILSEYLTSQTLGVSTNSEPAFLPDLLQIWSFASQSNNTALLTMIPSTLTLLLNLMSSLIDFREHGIRLSRILLQPPQLKYISRGLNASKQMQQLISSCLELLSEIVSFDGGVLAKEVFAAKRFLFEVKTMARNLSKWAPDSINGETSILLPTVRKNAIRYLLALVKFLNGSSKIELVNCGTVWRALFDFMPKDFPDITEKIIDAIKTEILVSETVSRKDKNRFLNDRNMSAIASLYKSKRPAEWIKINQPTSKDFVHNFLVFACTNPSSGIIQPSSGWYPPGSGEDAIETDLNDSLINGSPDPESSHWHSQSRDHISVKNAHIASFLQSMRPYSDSLQSELLLATFKAVPELVADYFSKNTAFSFDPKLTSTWIGYASFIFKTIELPVPPFFGMINEYGKFPPPVSIILENILPRPLNRKTLAKCFNSQNNLITFFAINITTMAFTKLELVLNAFTEAEARQGSLWNKAKKSLLTKFAQRCPKIKDVLIVFRSTPKANSMQNEAILRLLTKYYRIMPLVALEETFEVAIPLANALTELEVLFTQEDNDQDDESSLKNMQTNHLLQIARWSPGMDWWNKSKGLKLSPFLVLLKLFVQKKRRMPRETKQLLETVAFDHDVFQNETAEPAIDALLASLVPSVDYAPTDSIYFFIDDCMNRLKRPIKYEDDLQTLVASSEHSRRVSLTHLVFLEQWAFAAFREEASILAQWIGRYIEASSAIGENRETLDKILSAFASICDRKYLQRSLYSASSDDISGALKYIKETNDHSVSVLSSNDTPTDKASPTSYEVVMDEDDIEDPSTLHSWSNQHFPTAIVSGALISLIKHLTSIHPEIRTQSLTQLHLIVARLFTSQIQKDFPEWQQMHLFLNELIATATPIVQSNKPLPHLVASFAICFQTVLIEPLNPLYEKVNRFLMRGPNWDISRLASYWVSTTVTAPPTDNLSTPKSSYATINLSKATPDYATSTQKNQHWVEVAFVLSALVDGIRMPEDLELLRARGSFEPLLALPWDRNLPPHLLSVIVEIVERAVMIEGGSSTLITRTGAIAWVMMLEAKVGGEVRGSVQGEYGHELITVERLRRLRERLWETCEKEKGQEWSAGMMGSLVAA